MAMATVANLEILNPPYISTKKIRVFFSCDFRTLSVTKQAHSKWLSETKDEKANTKPLNLYSIEHQGHLCFQVPGNMFLCQAVQALTSTQPPELMLGSPHGILLNGWGRGNYLWVCKRGHTTVAPCLVFSQAAQEIYGKPLPSAQLLMAANGRCGCSLLDCPTPKWAASIQEKMRAGDWWTVLSRRPTVT